VLARALRRLKETDAAIAAAKRALELRPDAIEPWLLLEELGMHAAADASATSGSPR
jgi:cytochrome c-type biogenesis protein CcmH/NrfG